jgi:hypothetical protein
VRRLLRLLAVPAAERRFRLAWSRWRRAHQAGARHGHRHRDARPPAPAPPPTHAPGPRAAPPPAALAPPPVVLTDAQWARVAPLLPVRDRSRGGRPPRDPRPIVAALLWLARTGAGWRELPAAYGAWLSIYRAYQRWAASGLWPRILQALQEGETDR